MHRPLEVEENSLYPQYWQVNCCFPAICATVARIILTPGNYMRNRTLADLIVSLLSAEGMDWDAFSHHFRLWVLV